MLPFRFLRSLHFKVASGVIATIVLISSLYFVADYRSNRRELLAELQESADQLVDISLQGLLELAMIGEHPELLQPAMERLGANSSVRRIWLLDPEGEVRFSSNPTDLGRRFSQQDEGCRSCHGPGASGSLRSTFLELGGQPVLRSVSPVPNRSECHSCHDPGRRHNGLLVIDFPTAGIWQRLTASFRDTLFRVGLTVLSTLVVLGVLMNKWVILPLGKLTRATGRLTEEVQSSELKALTGSDEIGQLAFSFDEMAQRVRRSILELKGQQAYLQNLMNSLPDGLIVVNRQLCAEMTNRAAERFWRPSQFTEGLTTPALTPEMAEAVRETLQTGALVTCEIKLESPAERARAGPVFLELYCSPVRNGENIDKVILLLRDVTRRKAFEAQVSRAERLASVGRLAAGFAHEINNPMAAITTCVEGLSRHVAGSRKIGRAEKREISEYLSTVGEAALRCKEITQRLLSASVERGPGQVQPVDLWEIVEDGVILVQHQARRQRAEIVARRGPDCQVVGNREKLSQLMLNLLLNSLESMSGKGKIEISLSRQDDFVELRVADSGCGIPEGNLEHIFDPFFTTKTEGRGTGLGLTISQWIVRQHQGRIHVSSQPGRGTTFAILFPSPEVKAE